MNAAKYQTKIGVGLHQPAFSTPTETLAEIDAKIVRLRREIKRLERHRLVHVLRHLDDTGRLSALDRRLHELEADLAEVENFTAFRQAVGIELRRQRRWMW